MALWIPAFARPQPAGPPISRRSSADSGGLYLLVDTNGFKCCHFDCRYRYDSKRKTLSVGTYPETGLADARKRRDTARKHTGRHRPWRASQGRKSCWHTPHAALPSSQRNDLPKQAGKMSPATLKPHRYRRFRPHAQLAMCRWSIADGAGPSVARLRQGGRRARACWNRILGDRLAALRRDWRGLAML